MPRLNYRHLQYFAAVVQERGVRAAAAKLHLTPQTISSQLRQLEETLGAPLLARSGRGVEPTEAGRLALRYAEEIFALGDELAEVVRSGAPERALAFRVGLLDSIPKSIAHWLLEPAMSLQEPVRIVAGEGNVRIFLHAATIAASCRNVHPLAYPPVAEAWRTIPASIL